MDRETRHPDDNEQAASAGDAKVDLDQLRERITAALKTCYDPEIPVDIYELGLIYGVELDDAGQALVRMTLTSPACPVAGSLPGEVEARVRDVEGVSSARVELVWDPPWDKEMMSEAAKLTLGFL
jgi:FeS assembly SUF system protein